MSVPEPSFVLRSRESPVSALCPLPGGQELLLGHTDGSLSLWSFETRRRCGPAVPAHAKAVMELACGDSKSGPVISQGRDGRILLWKTEAEETVKLRENSLLAVCSESSFCRCELWRDNDAIWRLAFVAANDAALCVLAPPSGPPSSLALPSDCGAAMALSAAPSVLQLIAGFESGHVAVFCLREGAILARIRPFEEPVMALSASPTAPRVCIASVGCRVLFFDIEDGALRQALAHDVTNPGVAAISWRQDGRVLALCGWDYRVRLMAARGAKMLAVLTSHRSRLVGAKFGARGRLCASDEVGTTSVWDLYPTDR